MNNIRKGGEQLVLGAFRHFKNIGRRNGNPLFILTLLVQALEIGVDGGTDAVEIFSFGFDNLHIVANIPDGFNQDI